MDIVRQDLEDMGTTWDELVTNRTKWRQRVAQCINLDAGEDAKVRKSTIIDLADIHPEPSIICPFCGYMKFTFNCSNLLLNTEKYVLLCFSLIFSQKWPKI